RCKCSQHNQIKKPGRDGSYLIRDSMSSAGSYCMCVRKTIQSTNNKIKQKRLIQTVKGRIK
uniref:SH2 domain-containing protein n=1 Tax=Sinocyclocheilus rhinocerous TaxID=307959 RepID=A0A673G2W1_9TELE